MVNEANTKNPKEENSIRQFSPLSKLFRNVKKDIEANRHDNINGK
jgi:hypothetical protein